MTAQLARDTPGQIVHLWRSDPLVLALAALVGVLAVAGIVLLTLAQ